MGSVDDFLGFFRFALFIVFIYEKNEYMLADRPQ